MLKVADNRSAARNQRLVAVAQLSAFILSHPRRAAAAAAESLVTPGSGIGSSGRPSLRSSTAASESSTGCVVRRGRGIKSDHLEKIFHPQIMALAHLFHRRLDHAYRAVSHHVGDLPADLRQVRMLRARLISPAKPPSLWLFPFALLLSSCCVLVPRCSSPKEKGALLSAPTDSSFSISKSRIANQLGRMGHALPKFIGTNILD